MKTVYTKNYIGNVYRYEILSETEDSMFVDMWKDEFQMMSNFEIHKLDETELIYWAEVEISKEEYEDILFTRELLK